MIHEDLTYGVLFTFQSSPRKSLQTANQDYKPLKELLYGILQGRDEVLNSTVSTRFTERAQRYGGCFGETGEEIENGCND